MKSHSARQHIPFPVVYFSVALGLLAGSFAAPAGDVVTLAGGQALHVVDRTGKAVEATAIPEDLRARVQGIDLNSGGARAEGAGLVLAKVKLPAQEQNAEFGNTLVGNGWYDRLHYLNAGPGTNPGVICIRLGNTDGPCRLEVRKLKYQGMTIPIPAIDPGGKIIWLGELALEPYGTGEAVWRTVSGRVVTADGLPLNRGEATLRVNGTSARLKAPIANGAFAFSDISPGEYLVEFWIDDFAAATWWATVRGADVVNTITAYPRKTFLLGLRGAGGVLGTRVTAGIPYRDLDIPLPGGPAVRLNQEGDQMSLFCPSSLVYVPTKTKGDPAFTWRGNLAKGDVLELLNPQTHAVEHTIDCLAVGTGPEAARTVSAEAVPTFKMMPATPAPGPVVRAPVKPVAGPAAKPAASPVDLKAPLDWQFTAADGRDVNLTKMRGKVVLIDFWATWCGPCMRAVPEVVETYKKYHDKGFEVVGISFDQDKAALQQVTKEKGMLWPQYFDGKGWQNDFGVKYGIQAVPTMWLVDKQGRIASQNGRQDLAAQVESMLAQ